jgi:hypothetical protein
MMDIKTKHRKSAEQHKPKGRALFALAERKEAPFAAMFAALTLTLAAYVKTAFGGSPQPGEAEQQPMQQAHEDGIAAPRHSEIVEGPPALDFAEGEGDDPLITGSLPGMEDLGRIGRGPGMTDLTRFFPDVDPALDMPDIYLTNMPDIDTAGMALNPARGGPVIPTGFGGGGGTGGGGGGTGGTGGNGGTGGTGDGGDDAFAGISFHDLFAQMASVVRPLHATTVREISDMVIGDWVSQHELYKLRGGETRPDLDAAYLAREERTYDMVQNPDSREAFVDQFFPTTGGAGSTLPEVSLAEAITMPAAHDPLANPLAGLLSDPILPTDTQTGLL